LQQLGCTRNESIKLLNEFRQNIQPVAKAAPAPLADLTKTWNVFSRLADADADHPVVKYWITRGFDDPQAVADKYDLRYTQYGEWAMRVLLPLYYDGAIRTWTGRAASKQLDLRYKTNDIGDRSQLYIPAPPREVLYLVEGPIDALKITVALEGTAASAVALCSKDLNDSRILRLIGLGCKEVRVLFDNDAPLSQQFSTLNPLASHLRTCNVPRWRLPARYKDAAEAPEHELKALLGV
jgi:hypothetical protein